MWSSRLFWKLLLVYAGMNLVLAAGFLLLITRWQRDRVMQQIEQRLDSTAEVLRSHVSDRFEGPARGELQPLVVRLADKTDMRMTLVAADGTVLADSEEDPQSMENHRDRPELRQAGRQGRGVAQRRSPTLGIPMFYLALPIERDGEPIGFVRVAMSLQLIDQQVASVQRLIWSIATVVAAVALLLTYLIVGRIIRPLAQLTESARAIAAGDYQRRAQVDSRDEVGMLGAAFGEMQRELARRVHQLQDQAERLSTVLENMVEGVIAVDADRRILLANGSSKSMLNLDRGKVIGSPLLEAARCHPLNEAVESAFSGEESVSSEFEVPGHPRKLLALQATRLPGEPCPGVVVVLHDVSELRRLENLRREFVANVSHELKTPLASIKAYAETLRLGAVDDAENNLAFVGRIEEQADRLDQLIFDLIHLARVESGQELLEITEVGLAGVVNATVARLRMVAEAKGIELQVEPDDMDLRVRADEEGLRTILENLLDNAVKYTPEGGRVTVRCRADDTQAILEVEDTGVGIAPKDQERVFERFYRADKARSRELGGTGLGLAIVKHLAQVQEGSVELSSQVGVGSTFRVRLPRCY